MAGRAQRRRIEEASTPTLPPSPANGFLLRAALARLLVDRVQPRTLYGGTLVLTAVGYWLLESRAPAQALGRVPAVFFTTEGLATLVGASLGPVLAGLGGFRLAMAVSVVVSRSCPQPPAHWPYRAYHRRRSCDDLPDIVRTP